MDNPVLSVIIATRRRPRQLTRCLDSLAGQDLPPQRWEVIVVYDGEDPPSDDAAACHPNRIAVRRLKQPYAGCGIARNSGAAEARGQYLIFTDDDCLFPSDWLRRHEACFVANPGCMIAGASVNWLSSNPYSQATQTMADLLLRYGNPSPHDAQVALGNNMGVPAEDFLKLGGFSAQYFRNAAEDREFCARWLAAGRRISYQPSLEVFHGHELNLRSFLRQHYNYGRGAFLYHRSQGERRQRRWQPFEFYASMLMRAPSMSVRMLLVLSQMATAVGFARSFFRIARSGDEVVGK